MRITRIPLLAVLVAAAPLAPLAAQGWTPYDVFIFQNFTHVNSETNGRIAIGGDASLTNWGVGVALPSGYSDYSLVVGGDLTSNSGSVFNGRTYIGGAFNDVFTGFPAAFPPQIGGASPVDFATYQAQLTSLSNTYAALAPTGSVQLLSGELNFIGTSSYNVFNVTIAMLQGGTAGYEFVTPFGATNIINVQGSSSSSAFNNTAFYFDCTQVQTSSSCLSGANASTPADAALTLWNFNEQTSIDIGGPLHGSLLAPNADVTFGIGDVVGSVVAKSGSGNAEFYNNRDFAGGLPAVAPEPASIVLVATGLLGLAGVVRRRGRPGRPTLT